MNKKNPLIVITTLIPGVRFQQMRDPSCLTTISKLACCLFHSKRTTNARNCKHRIV